MIYSQTVSKSGPLSDEKIERALSQGLAGKFSGQKVLVLIPDHTRSLPLPKLFRMVVRILADTRQLDFRVALGTHPGVSDESINRLVGITAEERDGAFRHIKLLNHAWNDPEALATLGMMDEEEIRQLSGRSWHESLPKNVEIAILQLCHA